MSFDKHIGTHTTKTHTPALVDVLLLRLCIQDDHMVQVPRGAGAGIVVADRDLQQVAQLLIIHFKSVGRTPEE